jgi:hypothetical protein
VGKLGPGGCGFRAVLIFRDSLRLSPSPGAEGVL